MLTFTAAEHKYESILPDGIDWISVTTLVKSFKSPFDAPTQALKSSKNKKSKWYGMDPEEIVFIWNRRGTDSADLGTLHHEWEESELLSKEYTESYGHKVPVYPSIIKDGVKIAPEQKLKTGVYPEHLAYLKSFGVCGQADRVDIVNDTIHISDHKTYEEVKHESFKMWDGSSKRMLPPLLHLDECNKNDANLQLSLLAFMVQKHNPNLKVGELILRHIQFEEEARDQYGYPIYKKNFEGMPIVKQVVPIQLPYMKREAELMLDWLTKNRDKIRKKS